MEMTNLGDTDEARDYGSIESNSNASNSDTTMNLWLTFLILSLAWPGQAFFRAEAISCVLSDYDRHKEHWYINVTTLPQDVREWYNNGSLRAYGQLSIFEGEVTSHVSLPDNTLYFLATATMVQEFAKISFVIES